MILSITTMFHYVYLHYTWPWQSQWRTIFIWRSDTRTGTRGWTVSGQETLCTGALLYARALESTDLAFSNITYLFLNRERCSLNLAMPAVLLRSPRAVVAINYDLQLPPANSLSLLRSLDLIFKLTSRRNCQSHGTDFAPWIICLLHTDAQTDYRQLINWKLLL